MRSLDLVAVTPDGQRLILRDTHGITYAVAITAELRNALSGENTEGQMALPVETAASPREIQALIRSGESPNDVARLSGLPLDKVLRYASPILDERRYVADRALGRQVRDAGLTLAELLADRLGSDTTYQPDAWKRDDGRWLLSIQWTQHGQPSRAIWVLEPHGAGITPADDTARSLAARQGPQTWQRAGHTGVTAAASPPPTPVARPAAAPVETPGQPAQPGEELDFALGNSQLIPEVQSVVAPATPAVETAAPPATVSPTLAAPTVTSAVEPGAPVIAAPPATATAVAAPTARAPRSGSDAAATAPAPSPAPSPAPAPAPAPAQATAPEPPSAAQQANQVVQLNRTQRRRPPIDEAELERSAARHPAGRALRKAAREDESDDPADRLRLSDLSSHVEEVEVERPAPRRRSAARQEPAAEPKPPTSGRAGASGTGRAAAKSPAASKSAPPSARPTARPKAGAAGDTAKATKPAPKPRAGGTAGSRQSIPSWDEIFFGRKPEE